VLATIKLHAGDFGKGEGQFLYGNFSLPRNGSSLSRETIRGHLLETAEMASEENVKRIGGTVGWGVVGATLLGPVGLLAGLLLGGKGKEVTFVARFKDGRKLLGTTDPKTFTKIKALAF
jgi:hypothetical protein